MEDVTLSHAKEHLEELFARAARGEEITISDPAIGSVCLKAKDTGTPKQPGKRQLGRLTGVVPPPPEGFFDPMTEKELKDWYGDDA